MQVIGFNLSNSFISTLDEGLEGFLDIDLLRLEDGLDIELLLDLSWIELFFATKHRNVLEQVMWRTSLNLVP